MTAKAGSKPGRRPRPFTPFEQADIDMASKLRRWDNWEGGAHCAYAAHALSMSIGFTYLETINDPRFMGLRNAFRGYCNLWRGRHYTENVELPPLSEGEIVLPTVANHDAVYRAWGFSSSQEVVERFVRGELYSFTRPTARTGKGKTIPIKVVLGRGPGEDPRGRARKAIPVRYADKLTQLDLLACKLMDSTLTAQLIAIRMDRGEDQTTAELRVGLLALFHVYYNVLSVTGFDWTGFCWHPMFREIHAELELINNTKDSACGRFSSTYSIYSLIAYLRLRREAGGHRGMKDIGQSSLLYCEDSDCRIPLFYWTDHQPGTRGKPKVPHLCQNHDDEQRAAWRKRRERARKAVRRKSTES